MNLLNRLFLAGLFITSISARAETSQPFISFMAAPFAALDAGEPQEEYSQSTVFPAPENFSLNLHQGYAVRISAYNLYASFAQAQTKSDSEIPNARFKTITLGFLIDEIDDESYPVGLYTRAGIGFGGGGFDYPRTELDDNNLVSEVFLEGGLTVQHNIQFGIQGKLQSLFRVGDTKAVIGEVALVASLHL
jgi:hypothetical protein